MDSTIKQNEELLEQVANLIAAHVKEHVLRDSEPDVGVIEQGMRQLLQEVGRRALGKSITALDERYPQAVACRCGGEAQYRCRRQAKALTVFGWVTYRRAYHLCSDCGTGQSPLDERLGLRPGQVSAGLHPLLALLGVQTSFAKASKMAQQLLLLEVSDNTIRRNGWDSGARRRNLPGEKKVRTRPIWRTANGGARHRAACTVPSTGQRASGGGMARVAGRLLV